MRIKHFLSMLTYFIFIDAIWIIFVAKPLYMQELGVIATEKPDLIIVAALIYAILYAGLHVFVLMGLWRGKSGHMLSMEAILYGLSVYGVYTMTNYLVIPKWSMLLVATDIAWGIFLCLSTVLLGIWLRRFDR